jgi:arsenate reductase
MSIIKKILVICTDNSFRSQIAEGYLRFFARERAEIYSAGIEAHVVNPIAIAIMKEDHIDISGHTSNNLNEYHDIDFDYVITVCDNARDRCPVFPSTTLHFHCNFFDPAEVTGTEEQRLDLFRTVRVMIKLYTMEFVSQNL